VQRIRSHRLKRWRNGGWLQLPETKLYGEYGLVNVIQLIPSIASRARVRLWTEPSQMPISPRLDFRHWSRVGSITIRTAVYGSVRKVVWEGRRSDPPYPDLAAGAA
jgi:hypothetical protein